MTDATLAFGGGLTTSPAAPKRPPALYLGLLATTMAFATPTMSAPMAALPKTALAQGWTTTSRTLDPTSDYASAVRGLKDRTGLSWQQLANAFGVSRRSLHFWANGGNMALSNVQRLHTLADRVAGFGDIAPEAVRRDLFHRDGSGVSEFDRWVGQVTPARVVPRSSVRDQFELTHDATQHQREVVSSEEIPVKLRDF